MESGKIVLMKLFSGQEWRRRYREQTCGRGGEKGVGQMEKGASTHTHHHV